MILLIPRHIQFLSSLIFLFAFLIAGCANKSDSKGNFLIANGKSSDADDSTKPKTRQPIPINGTIVGVAYKTKDGDTTTQMKLHIDGVVEETIVLSSMNGNGQGRESFNGPNVTTDNYAEIEWDDNQKPGECTMTLIIQP